MRVYTHDRLQTRLIAHLRFPVSLTVYSETDTAYPESLVDVVHQGEQLYKVIHGDSDDGGAEGGRGEGDKAALPLKSEDSK